MLSYETIAKETLWVGKFYGGGRVVGTYDEIGKDWEDFRDFDVLCIEGQPEHLRDFYRGYFSQHEYYIIKEYYDNVYIKKFN